MKKSLESLRTVYHPEYFLGVLPDFHMPQELRLRYIAALKSYQFGLKSIDQVLKRYRSIWTAQLEADGKTRQ